MIIVPSVESKKTQASTSTTIWEFPTGDRVVSGAVAQIKGRYPEKGFAVNQKSKELAFVISGSGHVVMPIEKRSINVGDLIYLNKGEPFAWEGTLTIFMTTSPAFDPKQHIVVDSSQ